MNDNFAETRESLDHLYSTGSTSTGSSSSRYNTHPSSPHISPNLRYVFDYGPPPGALDESKWQTSLLGQAPSQSTDTSLMNSIDSASGYAASQVPPLSRPTKYVYPPPEGLSMPYTWPSAPADGLGIAPSALSSTLTPAAVEATAVAGSGLSTLPASAGYNPPLTSLVPMLTQHALAVSPKFGEQSHSANPASRSLSRSASSWRSLLDAGPIAALSLSSPRGSISTASTLSSHLSSQQNSPTTPLSAYGLAPDAYMQNSQGQMQMKQSQSYASLSSSSRFSQQIDPAAANVLPSRAPSAVACGVGISGRTPTGEGETIAAFAHARRASLPSGQRLDEAEHSRVSSAGLMDRIMRVPHPIASSNKDTALEMPAPLHPSFEVNVTRMPISRRDTASTGSTSSSRTSRSQSRMSSTPPMSPRDRVTRSRTSRAPAASANDAMMRDAKADSASSPRRTSSKRDLTAMHDTGKSSPSTAATPRSLATAAKASVSRPYLRRTASHTPKGVARTEHGLADLVGWQLHRQTQSPVNPSIDSLITLDAMRGNQMSRTKSTPGLESGNIRFAAPQTASQSVATTSAQSPLGTRSRRSGTASSLQMSPISSPVDLKPLSVQDALTPVMLNEALSAATALEVFLESCPQSEAQSIDMSIGTLDQRRAISSLRLSLQRRLPGT